MLDPPKEDLIATNHTVTLLAELLSERCCLGSFILAAHTKFVKFACDDQQLLCRDCQVLMLLPPSIHEGPLCRDLGVCRLVKFIEIRQEALNSSDLQDATHHT